MNEKETLTIDQTAKTLKVLSHPLRLWMLRLLQSGELCADAIARRLSIDTATASQHLRFMKLNGILQTRQSNRKVYYRIVLPLALRICDLLRNEMALMFELEVGRSDYSVKARSNENTNMWRHHSLTDSLNSLVAKCRQIRQ